MMSNRPSTFLRRVLFADAAISGVSGLLMALGAGQLSALLGLPEPLLRYAGLALLPWAALVAWLALRDAPPRVAVGAVILGNLLWAADCVVILTAHPELDYSAVVDAAPLVFDATGVTRWCGSGHVVLL